MQNIRARESAAIYTIVFWLVASFAVAVSGGLLVAGLGGTGAIWSTAALDAVERYTSVVAIIALAAFVLSAVCVGLWIYRASANAHAVSDDLTISPRWSVGFFFVPVMNLFKPYRAMRETWQASIAPGALHTVPVPLTLRIWWGLWLTSSVLGNVNYRLTANAKTIQDIAVGGWLDIIAVDVPMAVSLIVLIRRLGANQRGLVDRRVFE
ncbi:DUF4328 domain-containing protein [Sphingomonas sp. PAMC 26621]|uniref:DUF4328 domain-containing protein n=1 Tax=Sphingomonas sp. PAMC 26621 TaxID=1112213 RepID=UPI000288A0AE|nr:DUF4328 domain-containing protein [Sphingomonas sp. PAMC 26621]